jgi:hypothetical protein
MRLQVAARVTRSERRWAARVCAFCACLLILAPAAAYAQRFTFEGFGGSAYNVPTPLTVSQSGYPDIRFIAHYDTKPFGPYYWYYSWRASVWNSEHTGAWEFGQIHHRLFLENNPPEIQAFAIHFGYNFYSLGRSWTHRGFTYHADGGVLVCNPENTVRGKTLRTHGTGLFDQGYAFSGGGAQGAVSREIRLTNHLSFVGNVALLVAHARVPVVDGSAAVPNVSLHGQFGLAVGF